MSKEADKGLMVSAVWIRKSIRSGKKCPLITNGSHAVFGKVPAEPH